MKYQHIFIIACSLFFFYQEGNAQTLNWRSLEGTRHIIHASIGWDYGLSYSLGYAYQFRTNIPVILSSSFSIPSGNNPFDDYKSKLGAQVLLLNQSNLKGSLSLHGIFRSYENSLIRLRNVGGETKGVFGYYQPRWFVAGEVGFDKAIVTHFRHSDTFKEHIFQEVLDGWYEPASGGNFHYGFQAGYSFRQLDLTFAFGKVVTEDFRTTPLIPYYVGLGLNYRWL